MVALEGGQFRNYLFGWPCSTAYEILVPQPGVSHLPPAVELRSLHHWTARQVPGTMFQASFEAWAPKAIVESGSCHRRAGRGGFRVPAQGQCINTTDVRVPQGSGERVLGHVQELPITKRCLFSPIPTSTLAQGHSLSFDPSFCRICVKTSHSKLLQWQEVAGNSWELLLASGNILECLPCGSCAPELLGPPDLT